MICFAFALTPVPTFQRRLLALRAHWLQRSAFERGSPAAGSLVSVGLVVALALTCQVSVLKGERFRTVQQGGADAAAAGAGCRWRTSGR